jgi:hypothetical protein
MYSRRWKRQISMRKNYNFQVLVAGGIWNIFKYLIFLEMYIMSVLKKNVNAVSFTQVVLNVVNMVSF